MIRHILKFMSLSLLAGGVVACSSDREQFGTLNAGMFSLDIVTDDIATVAGGNGENVSTGYAPAAGSVSLTMTAEEGGYAHTWDNAEEFPQSQFYIAGVYNLSAISGNPEDEGFDKPAFYGSTDARVVESQDNRATVSMSLANSLVRVHYTESACSEFTSITSLVHTPGGLYHDYSPSESRYLCLSPGDIEVVLDIVMADGCRVTFPSYTIPAARAATLYELTVDCEATAQGPKVTVDGPAEDSSVVLTEEFINAEAPTVTTSWNESETFELPEGNLPSTQFTATIASRSPLRSIIFSTRSRSLAESGMPAEVDLLHLTPEIETRLRDMGLRYSLDSSGGTVTLDGLMGNLVYLDEQSALSGFAIMAEASDGKTSMPASLVVRTTPVEIAVTKMYPVTMGVDRACIEVQCDASGFMEHVEIETSTDPSAGVWSKVSPLDIEPLAVQGMYSISFDVASGSVPVAARILYCDEVRSTFDIPRAMPAFTIDVDAYATMAAVKVIPSDPSLTEAIAASTRIYINGQEAPVYRVVPEKGILSVIGLSPSTSYEFKATMMSGVDNPEFTPAVSVTTESTPQLPNADFEDRDDGVKYKDLAMGGRYSQTVVQIFNWQHHTTIDQEIPKHWANTNAKTFAMASTNHNTWYMQPSVALTRDNVFSQSFAVMLTSVAFDPHGAPIPDYTQTGTPYLDYSPIVPNITYRAAGKLFLGSYAFDPASMQESYVEGLDWSSRPSSLNGYYRFFPGEADRSDCGLVTVEVLGNDGDGEVVIASGRQMLALASSYTAFSVPLDYRYFGVKARRIKVMFSSSVRTGTIEEESRSVITVPDPLTASSTGGRLWIDNVTLAY